MSRFTKTGVALAAAALVGGCSASAPGPNPGTCALDGGWTVQLTADDSIEVVAGRLTISGAAGDVELVATSREGTREPVADSVHGLVRSGDSVAFSFAPIDYRLAGRCTSPTTLEGRYTVVLQSPDTVHGSWTATKR